jgi:hypothetical protein
MKYLSKPHLALLLVVLVPSFSEAQRGNEPAGMDIKEKLGLWATDQASAQSLYGSIQDWDLSKQQNSESSFSLVWYMRLRSQCFMSSW